MNLFKPLILVSISTTFTRTLGFIKDIVVARIFGASVVTDSFFISFRIINLLKKIFAEGAFFQIFIPLLIEFKNKKSTKDIQEFINCAIGTVIILLFSITISGIIFSPLILKIIVPGFVNTNYKFILTTKILRIIFPYIIFVSLSSIIGAIQNTWNEFTIPSLAPSIISITIILFIIFSSIFTNTNIFYLSWSLLFGSILQFIYQLIYLKDINIEFKPKFSLKNEGLIIIIKKMWPILLSLLISQIAIISNTIFASFLSSGSVSWMYYADRIIDFPSGILAITLNTILFPALSYSASNNNKEEYSKTLDWGLRLSIILTIPISILLIILSKPIIISVFQYGKFSDFDTKMTNESLISYAIGLIGIVLVRVLTPSFYSYQDTKTPLKVSFITFLVTQVLNFILIAKYKHIGLSLSIGLTSCFNSILLYLYVIKNKLFNPQPGWLKFYIKVIISNIILLITLVSLLYLLPYWEYEFMLFRIIKLFFIIFIGLIVYIYSLFLMGFNIKDFNIFIKSN